MKSVAEKIIKDKINNENIIECIAEFERFITDKHDGNNYVFDYNKLTFNGKKIYNMLLEIKISLS